MQTGTRQLGWMLALSCAQVLACNHALTAHRDGSTFGQTPDGAVVDEPAARADLARACAPATPFAVPSLVAGGINQIGSNAAARFSPGELDTYFSAIRPADAGGSGAMDIYVARRSQLAAAFGAAQPLAVLNSSAYEYDATVTGDGRTLYYGSNRSGLDRIYVSTWDEANAAFSAPLLLDSVVRNPGGGSSATLDAYQPYVLPDDGVLYLASRRSGASDLYRAQRGAAGFGDPVAVAELNTPFIEYYPTVTPDELVIYWGSNRTDGGARGGFDIWMATRASTAEPFANVRNVQELNTPGDDQPSWISPDGCRLYLSSGTAPGGVAVYLALRSP